MNVDNLCLLCGSSDESTEHVVMDCSLAKATWFGGLGLRSVDGDGQQFLQ